MMKQIKNFFVLFIILGVQAAVAQSNGNGNGNGNNGGDPCAGLDMVAQSALIYVPQNNDVPQGLEIKRTAPTGNDKTCNFFIVISNGSDALTSTDRVLVSGQGNKVPIDFYSASGHVASNLIYSFAEANTAARVISGTFTGNSTTMLKNYYPYLDTSVNVPVGNYGNLYDITLYKWDGSNFSSAVFVVVKNNVSYKYDNDTSISLSLVNDGSLYNAADVTQTLDFGTLTSGESLGFDLWLVYTNGYKLSLISTNGGNLKNTAVATSNLVPYTLSLDNVNVPLSSTETVVKTGTGASPSGGTKVDVTATIVNVGTVYAGTYNDYVTFKVSAP